MYHFYFLRKLILRTCIPTNSAPNNEMFFIHKQSHNGFWLKHFVNELILRLLLLHFLATLYANQCHCWMLVINPNPWIKYSPACSTTKRSTPFSIMAHNTIHMNDKLAAKAINTWWGKVHVSCNMHQISSSARPFDMVQHLNRPVAQRFSLMQFSF